MSQNTKTPRIMFPDGKWMYDPSDRYSGSDTAYKGDLSHNFNFGNQTKNFQKIVESLEEFGFTFTYVWFGDQRHFAVKGESNQSYSDIYWAMQASSWSYKNQIITGSGRCKVTEWLKMDSSARQSMLV